MADLPPPPAPEVEIVIVHPPRLAPLGGEAAFSTVQVALKSAPGVSLFRRTGSGAANPTTQGLSLRAIAPSGAGRALVTLDGAPQNDPFGGWVIWNGLSSEAIEGALSGGHRQMSVDVVRAGTGVRFEPGIAPRPGELGGLGRGSRRHE